MKKRVLSMLMTLALCLTLFPAPAWATEDAPEGGTIVQQEQQEKAEPAEDDQCLYPVGGITEGHATENRVACIDPEDVGDLCKRKSEGLGEGEGVLHLRAGRTDRDRFPGHHHTGAEKDGEDQKRQKQPALNHNKINPDRRGQKQGDDPHPQNLRGL